MTTAAFTSVVAGRLRHPEEACGCPADTCCPLVVPLATGAADVLATVDGDDDVLADGLADDPAGLLLVPPEWHPASSTIPLRASAHAEAAVRLMLVVDVCMGAPPSDPGDRYALPAVQTPAQVARLRLGTHC